MVLDTELHYRYIIKTFMEERKTLEDLDHYSMEVHLEILNVARGKIDAGTFGAYQNPSNAASRMGFFLPDNKEIQRELKSAGLTAGAHEWPYISSVGHCLSMTKLAAKMKRDKRKRALGSMDEDDSIAAIMVRSMIYSELAEKLSGVMGSFMMIAISKGKTSA